MIHVTVEPESVDGAVATSALYAPATTEVLQVGMLLCAVVWMNTLLGSDNFIVPKMLVLTAAAFAAAVLLSAEARSVRFERADVLLLICLVLLIPSTLRAVSQGYAVAAAAAFAASLILFWVSRSLAAAGRRSELVGMAAIAIGLLVLSGLLEAYMGLALSSRPPGGTVGNRNRLAHLAVIGLPSLALLTTWTRGRVAVCTFATLGAMSGTLILLSRSRGAWLALVAVVLVGLLLFAARVWRGPSLSTRARARLTLHVVSVLVGGTLALLLPNRLEWVSSNPYRDSALTLIDYREGTGAGRIVEYRNTIVMIANSPLLGVGPGNWRVHYPTYASEEDPNLLSGIVPARRYPQSEWLGAVSERGLVSSIALITFFGLLLRRWAAGLTSERSGRRAAYCASGILTIVAVGVVGLFDPVIQTPVAGFIVPVLLGAMAAVPAPPPALRPARAARAAMVVGTLVIGVVLVSAQVRAVWGTYVYARNPTLESLERAARIDPGSYPLMALTASLLVERGRCEAAAPYLVAARRMYPTAPHLDVLEERCRR